MKHNFKKLISVASAFLATFLLISVINFARTFESASAASQMYMFSYGDNTFKADNLLPVSESDDTVSGYISLNGINWYQEATPFKSKRNSSGVQIGTEANPTKSFSLETSEITGSIQSITVTARKANASDAKLSILINDSPTTIFSQDLTGSDASYAAENINKKGTIKISFENAKGAFYLYSVQIVYDNLFFEITNNLTHAINTNSQTTITENAPYNAELISDDGYKIDNDNIALTINGNDVTDLYVSNNIIDIPSNVVDGDIVITVNAGPVIYSKFDNEIYEGDYVIACLDSSTPISRAFNNETIKRPSGVDITTIDDKLQSPLKNYIWHFASFIDPQSNEKFWTIYNEETNKNLAASSSNDLNWATPSSVPADSELWKISKQNNGTFVITAKTRPTYNLCYRFSLQNFGLFTYSSGDYFNNFTLFNPYVPVTEIQFSEDPIFVPSCLTINTKQIVANVLPLNASNTKLTWTSSNDKVIKISNDGLATSITATGSVTLTAAATDGSGVYGTCTATVVRCADGISLSDKDITLPLGGSKTLIANVSPSTTVNKNVSWTSNDNSIATVDSNGVVRMIGHGTATITATTVDGTNLSDTCQVTCENSNYKYVLVENISELNDGDEIIFGYREYDTKTSEYNFVASAGEFFNSGSTQYLKNATGAIANEDEIFALSNGTNEFTANTVGELWNDKRLYQNPNNSNEFFMLNVSYDVGDELAIHMDGDNWYKYSDVKSGCISLVSEGADNNIVFNTAGQYDIFVSKTADGEGKRIWIGQSTAQASDPSGNNYSLYGSFNGSANWSNKLLFQDNSSYCTYNLHADANDEFCVHLDQSTWLHYINVQSGSQSLVKPSNPNDWNNSNIIFKEEGYYKVIIYTNDNSIYIEKNNTPTTYIPEYCIYGNFNRSNDWISELMVQDTTYLDTYYINNVTLKAGDKFAVKMGNNDWWYHYNEVQDGCKSLVDPENPDDLYSSNIMIKEDGVYNIKCYVNGGQRFYIEKSSDSSANKTLSNYIMHTKSPNNIKWIFTDKLGQILSNNGNGSLRPLNQEKTYDYRWKISLSTKDKYDSTKFDVYSDNGQYVEYYSTKNSERFSSYPNTQKAINIYKKVEVTDNAERFVSVVDICAKNEVLRDTYVDVKVVDDYANGLYGDLTNEEQAKESVILSKSTLDVITFEVNNYVNVENLVVALHMDSKVEGQCLELYDAAKEEYINLSSNQKELFHNGEYIEEENRLTAWARAHGEVINLNNDAQNSFVKGSYRNSLFENSDQTSILIIIVSVSLLSLSLTSLVLLIVKKKHKKTSK